MRTSEELIRKKIANENIKVISFDVFDTLLVRPFFFPTDLFFFLDREAANLLGTKDLVQFRQCRKEAEKTARVNAMSAGREDVTFIEIYNVLKNTGIYPDSVCDALMNKELELEERFCYARESALDLMKYAISLGKRIIVTSDMYLPAAFIRQLLIKKGFPEPEHVFVSCEIGLTKSSGNLFNYVLQQLNIKSNKMIHIGDNLHSDVRMARKKGIISIPFYRPVDLLTGKNPLICEGKAFRYAYKQIRSSLSNYRAIDKFGTRCMIAVAANRIYDDPYRDFNKSGDFAGDERLFGNFALGMYCLAQGYWVYGLTGESHFDHVLFFSRDGYLPWLGYEMIREKKPDGRVVSDYVRTSRKVALPMLLISESTVATAAYHINWGAHSPKSLTKNMMAVLRDDAMSLLENTLQDKWSTGFSSQTEMMQHLYSLFNLYCDEDKKNTYIENYKKYFARFAEGNILTYDVGYHLRNEMILKSVFPNVEITAAYTHAGEDISLLRSKQCGIKIREFYSSTPYVSWLVRELFLTENAPSCIGYSSDGKEVLNVNSDSNDLINRLQAQAKDYMRQFVDIFQDDVDWLPISPTEATLPLEAFLHSPSRKDKEWMKNIEAENSIDAGLREFNCYRFWQKLRLDYWLAYHHIDGLGRQIARFMMLLFTDRAELRELVEKHISKKSIK